MMEVDVKLPVPRNVYETAKPGELTPFVPGRERRQQVVLRLQFFQRMAELLSANGELDQHLRNALAALSDVFPRCGRLALVMRDAPHRPWRIVAQRTSAGDEIDLGIAQAMANAALNAGRVIVASAESPPPTPFPAALLPRLPAVSAAATLVSAGVPLGALYLDAQDEAGAIESQDAEFLFSCAGQFGALLAGYRHAESERMIQAQDIELARRIQTRFLPTATPRFDGYEIADGYKSAGAVGGDLFDFLTLADGRPLLFIADVSGKGFPAALVMARIGAHLRAVAPRMRTVADVLRQLDLLIAGMHRARPDGWGRPMTARALSGNIAT